MGSVRLAAKSLGMLVVAVLVLGVWNRRAEAACTYGACAPSNATVSNVVVRSAASQASGLLSDRISQVVGGGTLFNVSPASPSTSQDSGADVGHAAGDNAQTSGVWASGSNHWIRDTESGTSFSGTISDAIGGYDTKINDGLLLGFALGYEHLGVNTNFNHGTLTGQGFALSPYVGYQFNDVWSVNAQMSHVWAYYDEKHSGVSGSNTGDRWSFSGDLNANKALSQNWLVGGSLGLFYVKEFQAAYTETNNNPVDATAPYTGEVRLKGTLGYRLVVGGMEVVPNVSARLEYDPIHSKAPVIDQYGSHATTSDFGATFGGGVRGRLGDSTTLTLEGTTEQFRPYMDDYGVNLTLRIQF